MTTMRRDDSGMTLVESLVAMAVSTVLLAGLAMVYAGTLRTVGGLQATVERNRQAEGGMQRIEQLLRAADYGPPPTTQYPVVVAAGNRLQFYAYRHDAGAAATLAAAIEALAPGNEYAAVISSSGMIPVRMDYAYSSTGCGGGPGLTETVSTGTFNSAFLTSGTIVTFSGGSTRCLVPTTIGSTEQQATFSYFTDDANAATPDTGCELTAASTTSADRVRSVQVRVRVQDARGSNEVLSRICLVNVTA